MKIGRVAVLSVCLVSLSTLFPGCGGSNTPPGRLSGKVTFDGQAVNEGSVQLAPVGDGSGAQVPIQGGGSYSFTTASGGVNPGDYRISIHPPEIVIPDTPTSPGGVGSKDVKNIPARYRDPATSGLTVTVKAGANNFDIEMKNEGSAK